jgi:hypothetical protein
MSESAEGVAGEIFKMCLNIILKCTQRYNWRLQSSECGDALEGHDGVNIDAQIKLVAEYTCRP